MLFFITVLLLFAPFPNTVVLGDDTGGLLNLRMKAEGGDAESQAAIAFMYGNGVSVERDHDQALYWYKKAAEQGIVEAQYNLGLMYRYGHGLPSNFEEAVYWYRKAANQGFAEAYNNLGYMYQHGNGVPKDSIEAHKWYNLAAANSGGDQRLKAVKNRDLMATKLTTEELKEAQRLAAEWSPERGDAVHE